MFVYKNREEENLINTLVSSSLITKEILLEIKKIYYDNPYHNFVHALYVAKLVTLLPADKFNLLEIKSLMYAALFHDALHTWEASELDEYLSFDIWLKTYYELSKKYDLWIINDSIFRHAILWTVFKNRWKIKNKYAIILADLDIWAIWTNIIEFCFYNAFAIWEEFWQKTEDWVEDYNFFKFLISVDKNILISDEVRETFPNSYSVMKKFMTMDKDLKIEMSNYLKENDITFEEFKNKYGELV